jgi:hypothetical protein
MRRRSLSQRASISGDESILESKFVQTPSPAPLKKKGKKSTPRKLRQTPKIGLEMDISALSEKSDDCGFSSFQSGLDDQKENRRQTLDQDDFQSFKNLLDTSKSSKSSKSVNRSMTKKHLDSSSVASSGVENFSFEVGNLLQLSPASGCNLSKGASDRRLTVNLEQFQDLSFSRDITRNSTKNSGPTLLKPNERRQTIEFGELPDLSVSGSNYDDSKNQLSLPRGFQNESVAVVAADLLDFSNLSEATNVVNLNRNERCSTFEGHIGNLLDLSHMSDQGNMVTKSSNRRATFTGDVADLLNSSDLSDHSLRIENKTERRATFEGPVGDLLNLSHLSNHTKSESYTDGRRATFMGSVANFLNSSELSNQIQPDSEKNERRTTFSGEVGNLLNLSGLSKRSDSISLRSRSTRQTINNSALENSAFSQENSGFLSGMGANEHDIELGEQLSSSVLNMRASTSGFQKEESEFSLNDDLERQNEEDISEYYSDEAEELSRQETINPAELGNITMTTLNTCGNISDMVSEFEENTRRETIDPRDLLNLSCDSPSTVGSRISLNLSMQSSQSLVPLEQLLKIGSSSPSVLESSPSRKLEQQRTPTQEIINLAIGMQKKGLVSALKSCLSIRKSVLKDKSVVFGSPQIAEFNGASPSNKFTPLAKSEAKRFLTIDESGENDPETMENEKILEEWERLTAISNESPEQDAFSFEDEFDSFAASEHSASEQSISKNSRSSSVRRQSMLQPSFTEEPSEEVTKTVQLPGTLQDLMNEVSMDMKKMNDSLEYEEHTEEIEPDFRALLRGIDEKHSFMEFRQDSRQDSLSSSGENNETLENLQSASQSNVSSSSSALQNSLRSLHVVDDHDQSKSQDRSNPIMQEIFPASPIERMEEESKLLEEDLRIVLLSGHSKHSSRSHISAEGSFCSQLSFHSQTETPEKHVGCEILLEPVEGEENANVGEQHEMETSPVKSQFHQSFLVQEKSFFALKAEELLSEEMPITDPKEESVISEQHVDNRPVLITLHDRLKNLKNGNVSQTNTGETVILPLENNYSQSISSTIPQSQTTDQIKNDYIPDIVPQETVFTDKEIIRQGFSNLIQENWEKFASVIGYISSLLLKIKEHPYLQELLKITKSILEDTFQRVTKGINQNLSSFLMHYFESLWDYYCMTNRGSTSASCLYSEIFNIPQSQTYLAFHEQLQESDVYLLKESSWSKLWIDSLTGEFYSAIAQCGKKSQERTVSKGNVAQNKFLDKVFGQSATFDLSTTKSNASNKLVEDFVSSIETQNALLVQGKQKKTELLAMNQILNRFHYFKIISLLSNLIEVAVFLTENSKILLKFHLDHPNDRSTPTSYVVKEIMIDLSFEDDKISTAEKAYIATYFAEMIASNRMSSSPLNSANLESIETIAQIPLLLEKVSTVVTDLFSFLNEIFLSR